MRRLLQDSGAEVIHLGHNRAAEDVVDAAVEEDAQGIAVSSYQGGHVEYFMYMRELLEKKGSPHVKIFGGGGGVIVPREIKQLHAAGIDRIFSPEDGRTLGLQGMIDLIVQRCDFSTLDGEISDAAIEALSPKTPGLVGRLITASELAGDASHPSRTEKPPRMVRQLLEKVYPASEKRKKRAPIAGITGPGGAGKSSLTDELVLRFLEEHPDKTVAIVSVDPTKRRTGGALLGDRIRMNAIVSPRVYMRSLATRSSASELSDAIGGAIRVCQAAGYDLILVESAGTGQKDAAITAIADVSLYVMTAEFGAQSQLEKIEMIDLADAIAINKFERRGSLDALRDVRKQYRRARKIFDPTVSDESLPVFGTIASQFNDPGVSRLYVHLLERIEAKAKWGVVSSFSKERLTGSGKPGIIPPKHIRYLSEISEACRKYRLEVKEQAAIASRAYALSKTMEIAPEIDAVAKRYEGEMSRLSPRSKDALEEVKKLYATYDNDELVYTVRGKEIRTPLVTETLSHLKVKKVALPRYHDWGDLLSWVSLENIPGEFPFTAGVFPLKRIGEDPARMFAGEGPPERTNARFHLLSKGQPAVRLSTAFDSVTLYGEDPHERPDIYGKIGESGVSVATIEDAEVLYSGFDLCSPNTSVSMTINGPAPIILAFYMNAAIRQQVRKFLKDAGRSVEGDWSKVQGALSGEEWARIRKATVSQVRGTVQADILKEDQAQNTCIFSTEFALKMMGDIQEYFIEEDVKNYYSVSISGYHIAEAGANPITQLALTLANGFTYVEYYLSRGMRIDDFAPNLSFFFSNGLDPEYSVIGRVARRIWAVAMRDRFGASERSQKLKYHIQTSGRSLHAMEMDFNDIRTTLQALMAIADNCNSLHTNAFDEALTTPTDASVRRALAIQMIINKEHGLSKNENPLQGSFIIEELTDLVEAAVLEELDRLTERGGVLGAMETQYQRSKIQEESLYYERLKHDGTLPIVGVNTFMNANANYEKDADSVELRRASTEEKQRCISRLRAFQDRESEETKVSLSRLKEAALSGKNIFRELMETVNHASLGQISRALYAVGGQYRRNM